MISEISDCKMDRICKDAQKSALQLISSHASSCKLNHFYACSHGFGGLCEIQESGQRDILYGYFIENIIFALDHSTLHRAGRCQTYDLLSVFRTVE